MNQKTLPFVRPALLLSLVSLPVVSQAALTLVNLAGASNTLSGTSTQGSTITIATTDSGFSTTNFGTVDCTPSNPARQTPKEERVEKAIS